MTQDTFRALLKAPLHQFGLEDWPAWYRDVAGLVEAEEAETRAAAVERLSMAAFYAEHARGDDAAATEDKVARARWLTDLVDKASTRHPDVTGFLLNELRYKGDSEPYSGVVLDWLRRLLERRPDGVALDQVEGAIVLIGGIGPWDGKGLPPILDHPSDYVRACAAQMLGRLGEGEYETAFDPDFLAALTEKELTRPGIAGPYWSATGFFAYDLSDLGFDALGWMLDIIERRSGPEPRDLPFNGIDFHVHELAGDRPEAVQRLSAAGRTDLALMAATEIRAVVPGMEAVLLALGDDPDPHMAEAAHIHLAAYYGVLHPRADRDRIRHLPRWQAGMDGFVIRYGGPETFRDSMVLFPQAGAVFDDATAWAAIDRALPPDRRGPLVRHYLDAHDAAPAPYQMGSDRLHAYASGASVALIGQRDRAGWQRIEILAGRDGMRLAV